MKIIPVAGATGLDGDRDSGKIMRRLLRDIAEGRTLGDTTTLADPGVLEKLKSRYADDAE